MRQNNRLNYYVKKWMVHLKSSLFSEGSKIIGKNLFGRVTADWKINVIERVGGLRCVGNMKLYRWKLRDGNFGY